ncbi:MAG: hypothetical protein Q9220_001733 [cf. Caloplaca sp. 1 TL-2023]
MTDRRAGHQPYMPRLSYRHYPSSTSISENSIITVGTDSSAATISTCATSPRFSSFNGSPRSFHFSEGPASSFGSDGASEGNPSPAFLSPRATKETKKKSSIFKFFTVKEPSTQAFEAYQEQMKKRGITQTGRANAVGLPGVSSARLPSTVPKVNSKWDGVPQTTRDRVRQQDQLIRQSFSSSATRPVYTSRSTGSNMTSSTSSSGSSTRSELRSNGKLKYDNAMGSLSDMYGWETPPQSSASATISFPADPKGNPNVSPTLNRERSSFFPPPPALFTSYEDPPNTPPPLDPPSTGPSPIILPSLPTPITPNSSVPSLPLSSSYGAQSNNLGSQGHLTTSQDRITLTSSGNNVLGPPVSATRKSEGIASSSSEGTEPTSILKRPALNTGDAWPLPLSPLSSPARTTTKSKRAHMKSVFGKDT